MVESLMKKKTDPFLQRITVEMTAIQTLLGGFVSKIIHIIFTIIMYYILYFTCYILSIKKLNIFFIDFQLHIKIDILSMVVQKFKNKLGKHPATEYEILLIKTFNVIFTNQEE